MKKNRVELLASAICEMTSLAAQSAGEGWGIGLTGIIATETLKRGWAPCQRFIGDCIRVGVHNLELDL